MSKHNGAGSQIIPLVNNDGIQAVLGRDLHVFLEVKERYTQWIARHIEKYSFSEGQDFIRDFGKSTGGRPLENHVLSMDMAKELAMLQGNAKGKQARQYFIECEKKARAPKINGAELTRLELIQIALNAEEERLALEAKNKELAPKADAYESFIDTTGKYSIGAVAKMLGMGDVVVEFADGAIIVIGGVGHGGVLAASSGEFVM
ncbi:antA/AntB antirepressor family protein [Corynebacterium diphtheriae]|uniref:antA/AntB antirepressor family protein n=1 Tax=Corynebacterium diphtheriae TaxID=1717 RepID=UPI0018C9CAA7|nr:antA/AntB antirepressor family protein [Corynebacterium diphtheriae]MBG9316476.1 antA/AntB antirepressor family protein [Corynebacterium diphtheriae bv. mitis]